MGSPEAKVSERQPAAFAATGQRTAELRAGFETAKARNPGEFTQHTYLLAGREVLVRLVGAALDRALTPALSHLEVAATAAPALVIEVWDEAATGVSCPLPHHDETATTWTIGQGLFLSAASGREIGYARPHSLVWFDRGRAQMAGWVQHPDRLSLFERGKPFHFLLSTWHHDVGAQIVHAGLVGRNGRGVLLPGMGGAGKSTSTLACLRHGLDYFGDDYIGLEERGDGSFHGHSVFSSTWLQPEHGQAHFPDLLEDAIPGSGPGEDKSLVLLAGRYRARMKPETRVVAIALPRVVDGADTTYRPAGKGEALLTAAPSSMLCLIPRPAPAGLHKIAAMVERLPCYWLEMGSDLATLPPRVDCLLEEALER